MEVKLGSGKNSEASLEARIDAAITTVFSHINSTELEHQTNFTVRVGKKTHIFDGAKDQLARGITDILIRRNGVSIAVLELKRPGNKLTDEDVEQGLSYARLIHPVAPLVIVTNGTVTWIYESQTGSRITGNTIDETLLSKTIKSAAKIAEDDQRRAISVLLGTEDSLWLELIKSATESKLLELNGTPEDTNSPFSEDFYIPRKLVNDIRTELSKPNGARIQFVCSDPGQGLSSVLRGVVSKTPTLTARERHFFLEADSSPNLENAIGIILESEFEVPLDEGQVRHWLRRVSHTSSQPLVIVIDDLELRHTTLIESLKTYSDKPKFGNALKFVIGTDSHVYENLTIRGKGKATSLGRRSKHFECQNLDDDEFDYFVSDMNSRGVHFMDGVKYSLEMRRPWVLRYMTAWTLRDDKVLSKTATPVIPSMVSTDLLTNAIKEHPDALACEALEDLADCFIEMTRDIGRSPEFSVETLHRYILPTKKVRSVLDKTALNHLIELGYLRHSARSFGRIISVRRPIVFATFVAGALSRILKTLLDDNSLSAEDTARAYTKCFSQLPMGDIIGAFALSYTLRTHDGSPLPLMLGLLSRVPSSKPIEAGTKAIAFVDDGQTIKFQWLESGQMEVDIPGQNKTIIPVGDGEVPKFIIDIEPWTMLAHFAMTPSELTGKNGNRLRFDPGVLLKVGQSEHPLRRPGAVTEAIEMASHKAKDGSIVPCHHNGFTEIGTLAIMRLLDGLPLEMFEQWVDEACSINSLPLLMRLDLVLSKLVHNLSSEKAHLATSQKAWL